MADGGEGDPYRRIAPHPESMTAEALQLNLDADRASALGRLIQLRTLPSASIGMLGEELRRPGETDAELAARLEVSESTSRRKAGHGPSEDREGE